MKKLLFPILVILMLVAGCLPAAPIPPAPPNEPPSAYIDSASPAKVSPGETVIFEGHGADSDGDVVAYQWRSSIDGELSTSASFETSTLSKGTHTVWFRVQDDNGDWSKEVPCHVAVLPGGGIKPVVASFDANPGAIATGESSVLDWNVSDAAAVTIEPGIGNVALTGTRVVSPSETTVYILTATNEAGSVTATAEVTIAAVPMHSVELFSIASEGGHVKKNGEVGDELIVGSTVSRVAVQAFLSFDISMIPTEAVIKSASLDLNLTTAHVFGSPFTRLGQLYIYNHQYFDLGSNDFVIAIPPGAIYITSRLPTKPLGSSVLTAAVQKQVDAGSSRFQIRLQFQKDPYWEPYGQRWSEKWSAQEPNYLAFGETEPKLVIEYED